MTTGSRYQATTRTNFAMSRLTALLLLLLSLPASAATGNDAIDWVQKMSQAMQELSYEGRFVYLHDDHVESMSILHVNDAKGKRERLVSLNGEAREILRDNANLTCVWPSSRQVVVDPISKANKSPLWIPDDIKRLAKFYNFSVVGRDRIADHPAVIISIQPNDQYRYGMKVWVQEKNGLLLQSNLIDGEGRTSEQIMFTELALLDYDDPKTFNVLPKIANGYALIRSHSGENSEQHPGDTRWQLKSMLSGFHIESSFRKKMPNSVEYIQQMILSDGMASVSIFIEKLADQQQLLGESSMGAINAYSTKYKDYGITAIGEVPAITVEKIAESVFYLN